jgi:hypothetical protein
VSGHSAMVCGGSGHGVVVMRSGGVHMLRLSTRVHVELIGKVLENECNYGDLL